LSETYALNIVSSVRLKRSTIPSDFGSYGVVLVLVVSMVKSGVPMQRIATDIVGELPETENGNKYILVVSDYFTKWTEAFAMANMEAGTVARIMVEEVVTRFGVPHVIQHGMPSLHTEVVCPSPCDCLKHMRLTLFPVSG
jgi:hypothetical protein